MRQPNCQGIESGRGQIERGVPKGFPCPSMGQRTQEEDPLAGFSGSREKDWLLKAQPKSPRKWEGVALTEFAQERAPPWEDGYISRTLINLCRPTEK